jgi:hypothetical protein
VGKSIQEQFKCHTRKRADATRKAYSSRATVTTRKKRRPKLCLPARKRPLLAHFAEPRRARGRRPSHKAATAGATLWEATPSPIGCHSPQQVHSPVSVSPCLPVPGSPGPPTLNPRPLHPRLSTNRYPVLSLSKGLPRVPNPPTPLCRRSLTPPATLASISPYCETPLGFCCWADRIPGMRRSVFRTCSAAGLIDS